MSNFFTPKKRDGLRRLGSSSDAPTPSFDASDGDAADRPHEEEDGSDIYSNSEREGSNRALSSWRKLRKRVRLVRQGSVLHRNAERGDHLRSLFVKRRIKEALMNSMSISEILRKPDAGAQPSDLEISQSVSDKEQGYELSVNSAAMAMMEQYDETFIEEVKKEIEKEMEDHQEPAIIQELNSIGKEYQERLKGYNEFPLEVRLKNFTYTVPIGDRNSKIMTVYNASCLYPIAKMIKRLATGATRMVSEAKTKVVLSHINLVLKPGKQYLVLGPPASGKSTLLQAIAGQLQLKKYEKVEGSISYNGRTLAVSSVYDSGRFRRHPF
jgi:ABC-type multidrug transport system fused ATPase/permease subunit